MNAARTSFASDESPLGAAVRDNVAALEQALELLAGLDEDGHTRRAPQCFNSSVGGHVRHVIEHYESLLAGLRGGRVDYESRPRDALIEGDPVYAAGRVVALIAGLRALTEDDGGAALRVRAETAPAAAAGVWLESCVVRELEFLLSHTVHHYALIAVIRGLAGGEIPKDFGVAPSTLRFLRASAPTRTAA